MLQPLQLGLLADHPRLGGGQDPGGDAGPRAAVGRGRRTVGGLHRGGGRVDFLLGCGDNHLGLGDRLALGGDLLGQTLQLHLRMRHEAEGEEHDEQGEQEHGQGRDVARPLALHPLARQPARIDDQQRQGAPEAAVEMHHPVQQFLAQMQQGAVHMGRLTAVGAEIARHLGPAVGAGRVMIPRLSGRLLDSPCDDAARHGAARCFQINHANSPRIRRGL
ncbi:hypothetical protein D3C72_1371150 [compost metagenome]